MCCITKTKYCRNNTDYIFKEALDHCRHKDVFHSNIHLVNLDKYKNKTFDEIYADIYKIYKNINQIGSLIMYDITSAICRYYNINIDKVYIVGNGPKRAIKLLNLETESYTIKDKIEKIPKLKYVEIKTLKNAFQENGYENDLNENLKNTKNGDIWETFLCNWQKDK